MSALVVGGIAYLASSSGSPTFSADAVVSVRIGQGTLNPDSETKGDGLTPDSANKLAQTYASQIPRDDSIVRIVASAIGVQPGDVRDKLFAAPIGGDGSASFTALIRLGYDAGSREDAIAATSTVVDAVTGRRPVESIIPRSLILVEAPQEVTEAGPSTTAVTIGGVIVGLLLGALLFFTLERTDRRLDTVEDLAAEGRAPASDLGLLASEDLPSLVERWTGRSVGPVSRIVVVPIDPNSGWRAEYWVPELEKASAALRRGEVRDVTSAAIEPAADSLPMADVPQSGNGPKVLLLSDSVTSLRGQNEVSDSDVIVFAARRGTPALGVAAARGSLEAVGLRPAWSVFV